MIFLEVSKNITRACT